MQFKPENHINERVIEEVTMSLNFTKRIPVNLNLVSRNIYVKKSDCKELVVCETTSADPP